MSNNTNKAEMTNNLVAYLVGEEILPYRFWHLILALILIITTMPSVIFFFVAFTFINIASLTINGIALLIYIKLISSVIKASRHGKIAAQSGSIIDAQLAVMYLCKYVKFSLIGIIIIIASVALTAIISYYTPNYY